MAVSNYNELHSHVGHDIECVTYGNQNVAVECIDCSTVLFDFDAPHEPTEHDEEADLMNETGILGRKVTILRAGAMTSRQGVVVGIYTTRKGPSFKIRFDEGFDVDIAFKRDEFELFERELSEHDIFYMEHQHCGHRRLVFFGKGDWIHLDNGSICNQAPEAPQ